VWLKLAVSIVIPSWFKLIAVSLLRYIAAQYSTRSGEKGE
jgi:hypothetical protein